MRIFPDGQIQALVMGIPGKKCTDYISVLEALLDAEVIDSEPTSEYYLNVNERAETIDAIEENQTAKQSNQTGLN